MSILKTVLASAIIAVSAGTASAATIYASSVIGNTINGPFDGPGRDDPTAALGVEDGVFYSLTLGGDLTLGFGQTFNNTNDVLAYEITFGRNQFQEAAEVYAVNGLVETLIGIIDNQTNDSTLRYAGTFDALRFLDVTTREFPATNSTDGFDLDAVSVSSIPLPAGGLLLLGGLVGLGVMRKRAKKA